MDYKLNRTKTDNSLTQNSDILSLVLKLSQEELMHFKSAERPVTKTPKKGAMLDLLRHSGKNITY